MSKPQTPRIPSGTVEALRHGTTLPYLTLADAVPGLNGNSGDLRRDGLSELAQTAADLIVAATGVDVSGLAMFQCSGSARMVGASQNRYPEWANLVVKPGDGVASRVVKSGGYVAVKDYAKESGSSNRLIEISERESMYAMLAVPIEQGGSIVGIAYSALRRPAHIGERGQVGLRNIAKLFSATFFSRELVPRPEPVQSSGSMENGRRVVLAELSSRERQILRLLGDGLTTAEVAATEFLALNTVRTYVQSALWKLGAHSRLQAVAFAREAGLI